LAYFLVLARQLSARTHHHQDHSSQQKSQHGEHKNNTPGKARTDPGNPGITGNVGWFLAPLTGHERWERTHQQRTKREKASQHGITLIYLPPRRKSFTANSV